MVSWKGLAPLKEVCSYNYPGQKFYDFINKIREEIVPDLFILAIITRIFFPENI
jgi:hypothetical protein